MNGIEKLYTNFAQRSRRFLWFTIALMVAAIVLMFSNMEYRALNPLSTNDHVYLQLVFEQEKFVDVVGSWVPEGTSNRDAELATRIQQYRVALLRFDILFPIAYALFGMYLLTAATRALKSEPSRKTLFIFALPLLAAILDFFENGLHLSILKGVSSFAELGEISAAQVALAATFASLKWAALAIALGYLAVTWMGERGTK